MAFQKGKPKTGGKVKGVANKSTTQAREAVAKFVDGNIGRLNNWLDRIAEDSPKDAFNCLMSVVEYHIPKLARAEHVGDKENPIVIADKTAAILAILTDEQLEQLSSGASDDVKNL